MLPDGRSRIFTVRRAQDLLQRSTTMAHGFTKGWTGAQPSEKKAAKCPAQRSRSTVLRQTHNFAQPVPSNTTRTERPQSGYAQNLTNQDLT